MIRSLRVRCRLPGALGERTVLQCFWTGNCQLLFWPMLGAVRGRPTPFDFSEKEQKCCGFGSVRARKPLLQLLLTVWPFGACVGAWAPFFNEVEGTCSPPVLRMPTVGPSALGAVGLCFGSLFILFYSSCFHVL